MPRRVIEAAGEQWVVSASGRNTQYTKDEFGLVFTRGTGAGREQRVVRLLTTRREESGVVSSGAE